ncbi:MAG TPA: Mpo1-like protein [Bdellovibrionales bacterium]|nr:Mpo1-like protein [Bdellovibrionales bacterium]
MESLENYFASYSDYHRTKGNKLTHYFGIPPIVFSTLGLLALVQFNDWLNLGLIVWLASIVFYCRLDWKMGIPFSALTFAMYWFARDIAWQAHVVLFVGGWILQLVGHQRYEKKSPAFLTNFSHLLIGPFWIFYRLNWWRKKMPESPN